MHVGGRRAAGPAGSRGAGDEQERGEGESESGLHDRRYGEAARPDFTLSPLGGERAPLSVAKWRVRGSVTRTPAGVHTIVIVRIRWRCHRLLARTPLA